MATRRGWMGFNIVLLVIFWVISPRFLLADPADNVLRLGYHVSRMGTFDPHLATASQDRVAADLVFNGLLRYVPGGAPQMEPDLAGTMPTFYTENGKLVCRLKLRRGVMFHDAPGVPSHEMTAQDVAFSLNRAADRQFSAYAGSYAGMSVKIIGPYTVDILLDPPLSKLLLLPLISDYGGGFIVSKKALDILGPEGFANHPVGTGPFKFQQHVPGSKVVFTANEQYFRGSPKLGGVEMWLMPRLVDREKGLQDGKLDIIIGSAAPGWIESIQGVSDIRVDTHGVGEVVSLYFNSCIPPMDDVRVRRAMAYALDRERFFEICSPQNADPVHSPVPGAFMPGGLTEQQIRDLGLDYALDLKKARELLTLAGYPDGFTLDLVTSEKRVYQAAYRVLEEQLKKIGVHCRIRTLTHRRMHQSIRDSVHPKPAVIYLAWRPNADAYLSQFFHSDFIPGSKKKTGTNFAYYDKIDRLIEGARFEIDSAHQVDLWQQAQIRILDDMVCLPLLYARQVFARHADLDYGHPLKSSMALYPQFTENTYFKK